MILWCKSSAQLGSVRLIRYYRVFQKAPSTAAILKLLKVILIWFQPSLDCDIHYDGWFKHTQSKLQLDLSTKLFTVGCYKFQNKVVCDTETIHQWIIISALCILLSIWNFTEKSALEKLVFWLLLITNLLLTISARLIYTRERVFHID